MLDHQILSKCENTSNHLKCDCGAKFQQIDDFQVHQLTSCPLRPEDNNSEDIVSLPNPVSENHINNNRIKIEEQLDSTKMSDPMVTYNANDEGSIVNSSDNVNNILSQHVIFNEMNDQVTPINEHSPTINTTTEQLPCKQNQKSQSHIGNTNLNQQPLGNELLQNDTSSQLLSNINLQTDSNTLAQPEISNI